MISPIDRISEIIQEESEKGLVGLESLRDYIHGVEPWTPNA